ARPSREGTPRARMLPRRAVPRHCAVAARRDRGREGAPSRRRGRVGSVVPAEDPSTVSTIARGGDAVRRAEMAETLTLTDNRSGRSVDAAIEHDAIHATKLKELGLASYDPAFLNTASVTSAITYIDGDAGILRYRGYPIEQLAERSTYLETAYLLVHG